MGKRERSGGRRGRNTTWTKWEWINMDKKSEQGKEEGKVEGRMERGDYKGKES